MDPRRNKFGFSRFIHEVGKAHRLGTATAEACQVDDDFCVGFGGEDAVDAGSQIFVSIVDYFVANFPSFARQALQITGAAAWIDLTVGRVGCW